MKEKKEKVNFKELIKDKKVRAYMFFGFYMIFFIILIFMIRTPHNSSNKNNTNSPSPTPSTDVVEKIRNYQYTYTVKEDNNTVIYSGKAYHNKELFTMIKDGETSRYFRLGDEYLINTNNKYIVVDNPYLYNDFFNLDYLEKLLQYNIKSTVKENVTTYKIDTVAILNTYYPTIEYDGFSISEVPDDEVVVTRSNDTITKVEFTLDNMIQYYSPYVNENHKTLKITIELYNFGQIEEFDI